jgi:hypothetical protein
MDDNATDIIPTAVLELDTSLVYHLRDEAGSSNDATSCHRCVVTVRAPLNHPKEIL